MLKKVCRREDFAWLWVYTKVRAGDVTGRVFSWMKLFILLDWICQLHFLLILSIESLLCHKNRALWHNEHRIWKNLKIIRNSIVVILTNQNAWNTFRETLEEWTFETSYEWKTKFRLASFLVIQKSYKLPPDRTRRNRQNNTKSDGYPPCCGYQNMKRDLCGDLEFVNIPRKGLKKIHSSYI